MSQSGELGRPLYAYIDTEAFRHNLGVAESLAPRANTVAVIKADGYGHGLYEMAMAAGTRDLAVASSNEAECLIASGIKNRIWVLEGPLSESCLSLNDRHDMLWVIHSTWQIDLIKNQNTTCQCWLKVDTGMHRLGFRSDLMAELLASVQRMPNFKLFGLMTHFASSDELESVETERQLSVFKTLRAELNLSGFPQTLANSGGVLNYPDACLGWVRPGIMLYGCMPDPAQKADRFDLKPVMHLRSKVIALNDVPAGDLVGYGGTWTAQRDSRIAVVACGYGDGYPRHAVNGTPVLINGERALLAGRVSMDMLTVDVTDLAEVAVGNEVELWGAHISIDEVALNAGTISYEILTQITKRVPRYYSGS